MADEHDMAAPGKVSIWVGDFADEMEALDYVESGEGFGRQFGCVLRHRRELVAFDDPKPLRQLLEGFSSWRDFIGEVSSISSDEVTARCAVVAYACDYRLLQATPRSGRMHFLGVADFGQNAQKG